jgi:hypothetical protein
LDRECFILHLAAVLLHWHGLKLVKLVYMGTDIQFEYLELQALAMVMMLYVEEWFLCVERQHAIWRFHMRGISFLVSGGPSGPSLLDTRHYPSLQEQSGYM